MATTNAERLKRYKTRMKQTGFRRLNIWVHPDLAEKLTAERQQGECVGRTLERLLLGQAKKRPNFPYGGDVEEC
jgi:molybdenum cofactor biosynthesis enzyme MoaA